MLKMKQKIVRAYLHFVRTEKRYPSWSDLCQVLKSNRSTVRHYYSNLETLQNDAREADGTAFVNVLDLSPETHHRHLREIKSHKIFVVASVTAGQKTNTKALKSIKNYIQKKSGKMLLIATKPLYRGATFDRQMPLNAILTGSVRLNAHLSINPTPLCPKQVDTTSGLSRFTKEETSVIVGSPRRRFKLIPSYATTPRAIISTQSLTLPNYVFDKQGIIATELHKNGALIIEVIDDRTFVHRYVTFNSDGSFTDLGYRYRANGTVEKVKCLAMVDGDEHALFNDKQFEKAKLEMYREFQPDVIYKHDVFDAYSISHHHEHDHILKARKGVLGSLCYEAKVTAQLIEKHAQFCREVRLVKSNHDEHINRYLSEGRYIKDPINHRLSHQLVVAIQDGKDPEEVLLRMFSPLKNVVFLKRNESSKVAGYECGFHGDKGPNGARGSTLSLENLGIKMICGHTHTPEEFNDFTNSGTSSVLNLEYNEGDASTWLHGTTVIWADGSRQLITAINGIWRRKVK